MLLKLLDYRISALSMLEYRQIVDSRRHIGVLRSQDFLPDRQGTLVKLLSIGILALSIVESSEIVKGFSHVKMLRPRSVERRVGKAWRSRWWRDLLKKNIVESGGIIERW